jgi:hypothetical protein
MLPYKVVLAFLIAASAFAHAVRGQEISPGPSQLALEVHFYPNQAPAYQTVPDSSQRGAWYGRFGHVTGWTPPANSLAVTAVNIKSLKAEDGVRVWVSVFLGQLHEEEQKVSSYVLHEGDKVTVEELTQVGVVPFEIKVVKLAASVGEPPQFSSRAKSIEAVSMQPNFSATPSYEVVLRNASGKAVEALEVQTLQGGRPQLTTMPQGKEGQPLILPGGTFKMTAHLANRATPGPNGYAPQILPNQTIEISAAVFDDGSFEGASSPAMAFTGFKKGRKIQLARVVEVFQSAINGDASSPDNVASLKNAVAALDLQADDAAVADLHAKFPQEAQTERLRHVIELGMKGIRDDVLNDITQFELHNRRADASAVAAWLTSSKNRYQAWLGRL